MKATWVMTFAVWAAAISAPAGADSALDMREVAPGIYVHLGVHQLPDAANHGEIANIGFIVGEKCVAVIDTGGSPRQGEALKAAIRSRTSLPVCYVINTHVHPDHIHGNVAFKQPDVRFVGHRKLAQAMAARAPHYLTRANREWGLTLGPQHYVPPDIEVDRNLTLDLGGRVLQLVAHGPAHTDNDLSVFDERTRTLWLADLLFMEHIPVVDGSLNGWLKELEALKRIEAKLAIPGHGPLATAWPEAASAETRYLESLRREIRAFIRQGKPLERAMEEVGLSARAEWSLFDEFHKRNVAKSFAELEWEDD
jgi:quinoprotein relay system zinc metallohydrolase 2